MIQLELTTEEAQALLKLLMSSTNQIIAASDPDHILEHLESVEEKIQGAMSGELSGRRILLEEIAKTAETICICRHLKQTISEGFAFCILITKLKEAGFLVNPPVEERTM